MIRIAAIAAVLLPVTFATASAQQVVDDRTHNAPGPAAGRWVVEGGPSYSRGRNIHSVTCVPEAELAALPRGYREWKDIQIPADQAYTGQHDDGTPCPAGPLLSRGGRDSDHSDQ